MTHTRPRRWAEALVAVGLCLMAMTAVAWADAPVPPVPTPVPTPEATATVPVLVATPVPTATPTAVATVTAAATATAALSATPTATATATATPTATATATTTAVPRQAAEPTPTATPPPFSGAQLTVCVFTDAGYETRVIPANQPNNEIYNNSRNIVPAPPGGCDGVDPEGDPLESQDDPLYLCHATGDPERPFVLVGPRPPGDYGNHGDHTGDLIPAPNNTCPGLTTYADPTVTPTSTPTPRPRGEGTPAPAPQVGTDLPPVGEVLDEIAAGVEAPAGTVAPAQPAAAGATLPFTGPEHLVVLFLLGTGLVVTGVGARLLSRPTA